MSRQPLFLATFTLHIITCSRGTPLFETVILSSLAVLTEETFKDNWCENTAILLFRSSKCEENVHIYSELLAEAASTRRKVLLDLCTLLKQQYLLTSSALVPSQSLYGEDSTTTTTQKSFRKDFFSSCDLIKLCLSFLLMFIFPEHWRNGTLSGSLINEIAIHTEAFAEINIRVPRARNSCWEQIWAYSVKHSNNFMTDNYFSHS